MVRGTAVLLAIATFWHHNGADYIGNPIRGRSTFLRFPGHQVFVDNHMELGTGLVHGFEAYVHDVESNRTSPIWLQIWRSIKGRPKQYQLRWQKKVELNEGVNKSYSWFMTGEDQVHVTHADRLGFACEPDHCPISLDYVEGHPCHVLHPDGAVNTGQVHHFRDLHQSPVFSIGVHVHNLPGVRFYGNDVMNKTDHVAAGAEWRAFVDMDIFMPKGYLQEFRVHVTDIHQDTFIQLQIWREEDNPERLILRFSKNITLTRGGNRVYKIPLEDEEQVFVDSRDRLGWACESDQGPVSYSFNTECTTLVLDLNSNEFPHNGDVYEFGLAFPYEFSIGVLLKLGHLTPFSKTEEYPRLSPEHTTSDTYAVNVKPHTLSIYLFVIWTTIHMFSLKT